MYKRKPEKNFSQFFIYSLCVNFSHYNYPNNQHQIKYKICCENCPYRFNKRLESRILVKSEGYSKESDVFCQSGQDYLVTRSEEKHCMKGDMDNLEMGEGKNEGKRKGEM